MSSKNACVKMVTIYHEEIQRSEFSIILANERRVDSVQTELEFEPPEVPESQPATPLSWITRTYQSKLDWQNQAQEVFLSVNGDSNVARNRVATRVRQYFTETRLEPEDVQRWKKGANEIETIRINPPKLSESNSGYVDWLHIANFLLMAGCAEGEARDKENQTRETEYLNALRSYKMRVIVEDAREELRREPALSNESLLERVKKRHADASLVSVKEARRLEKVGARTPPARAPIKSEPIPRYTTLYF